MSIEIILNSNKKIRKAFFKGYYKKNGRISSNFGLDKKLFFKVKNKLKMQILYYICKSLGYKNLSISFKDNNYYIESVSKYNKNPNIIKKMYELRDTKENEFVYDLETETGNFLAGIGQIVVKNTDSVFLKYNAFDKKNGKLITGIDHVKKSIQISMDMEDKIHKLKNWQKPQYLEYEKVFYPFILLSKKRYIGNKYEMNIHKFKQTSMGVVTKRRDNAQVCKIFYGGILDIIMNEKDINKSIKFLQSNLIKLINGNFDISKFIISKTLKGFYKCPESVAHYTLAKRIEERTNIKIPSNTRIPYVFVKTKNTTKKKLLQGDRIEDPDYIIKNKLKIDYTHYITNQIMKPVCQIYALIITDLKQFKHDNEYFLRKEKSFKIENKTETYIKTKIQQLKTNKVKELLFDPIMKQVSYHDAAVTWGAWGFKMT